jgi:Zn-dependent protease with chaperone function
MHEPSHQSATGPEIEVERWPSELPLLVAVIIVSIIIWGLCAVSILGLVYALFIGAFLFLSHVGFIAYLRGSAVRISPDQFPELDRRIREMADKIGLDPVPEAYLMQAGGALNALATKLLATNFIVLYSDLLDACGENQAARDMIIGHELGHIKARHLSFMWLIMPGLITPFLGTFYSQAREYTCDRYGLALSGDHKSALRGLAILSAGATHGPKMNLVAFAKQRDSLNTGLMRLGSWLSTHPPLTDRVTALEPQLYPGAPSRTKGALRAVALIAVPVALWIVFTSFLLSDFMERFREAAIEREAQDSSEQITYSTAELDSLTKIVNGDLYTLGTLVDEIHDNTGQRPASGSEAISAAWQIFRPSESEPLDPFDGNSYGYYLYDSIYVLWSSGPDGQSNSDDDIVFWSPRFVD